MLTEHNDRSQVHSQICSLAKFRSQRGTHYLSHTLSVLHITCLTHYLSYASSVLHIICLTQHLSYTLSALHIICLTHYLSYALSVLHIVLHIICLTHYLSYALSVLRIICLTHYLSYTLSVLHIICPNGSTYLFTQQIFCYEFFFMNIFLCCPTVRPYGFLYFTCRVRLG